MSELLFGLIFAHFVADFILRTKKMNVLENSEFSKEQQRELIWHTIIHLGCYIMIFFFCGNLSYKTFGIALLIAIFHYFIDSLKVLLAKSVHRNENTLRSVIASVLDQFLHIAIIYMILHITKEINYTSEDILHFFESFLDADHVVFSLKDKFFLLGSLIIITTYFYGYLLGCILRPLKPLKPLKPSGIYRHEKAGYKLQLNINVPDSKVHSEHSYMVDRMGTTVFYGEPPNQTGKYIGMLERLIISI